jgi:hypothetical protein
MNRNLALRCLAAAAATGIAGQALLYAVGLGINVPILGFAVLVAGLAVSGWGRRLDPLDAWIPVAAAVVAVGPAIRTDSFTVLLDLGTVAALLGASMAAFAGAAVTRRSAAAIAGLGVVVIGWTLVGVGRLAVLARRPRGETHSRPGLPPAAMGIARGLLIAVPVLVVFGMLFASADAVFASIASNLFGWQIDLGQAIERSALALGTFWIVAGLVAVAAGIDRGVQAGVRPESPAMQSLGAAVAQPAPTVPRLGATEALTVLVTVAALFAIFVALQLAYLFGGLDTIAAGGITYSDYARRGFFELVAVTALAGGLVIVLYALVEHRGRAFVWTALALAALTFVILASAAYRLRLYQDAYGWTELRFYIYATIAWMAVVIVGGSILLARERLHWLLHVMTIAALVVLIGVNAIGAQRHVADENVARLLDPALVPEDGFVGLDEGYALWLEDDAVPALVRALPALSGEQRQTVMADLERRWNELNEPSATAWPARSLARERARDALRLLFTP